MAVKSFSLNENELIADILKSSSCFLPLLKDISQEAVSDKGVQYTKKNISPLFSEDIMTSEDQQDVLKVILSSVPYYCLSSENFSTRDCGINDVPRSLQTPFWSSWYRDALGDSTNFILNKIYNELGFTFLRNIDILNKNTIYRFIDRIPHEGSFVDFIRTQDFSKIIEKKLSSISSLLNYTPRYNKFLDKWAESEYSSGKYDSIQAINEEVYAYKAQDIQYELIRRKLEGSSEMYRLALRAINYKGSIYQTAPFYMLTYEGEGNTFKDDREIRIFNLDGFTVAPNHKMVGSINPLAAFKDKIPKKIITPLYYFSKNQITGTEYSSTNSDNRGFLERPSEYIKYNSKNTNLDEADVIVAGASEYKIFTTLDRSPLETLDDSPLKTLDSLSSRFNRNLPLYNALDIDAQQVLYHENILQKELGTNYPYVTYPISGGKSLSSLDPYWIDYLTDVVEQKSSVNTSTKFGAQFSKYFDFQKEGTFESLFCIDFVDKYGVSLNSPAPLNGDISSPIDCEYIDIYYIKIFYNPESSLFQGSSPRLITRIDRKSCKGILPFTYDIPSSKVVQVMTPENPEAPSEEKLIDYEDCAELQGYSLANFRFSDSDNEGIINAYQSEDIDEDIIYKNIWKKQASLLTRSVIYGVVQDGSFKWSSSFRVLPYHVLRKYFESNSENYLRYLPDWSKMIAYYNPYLNFVANSASPARGHKLNSRALRPFLFVSDKDGNEVPAPAEDIFTEDALIGPSENVALCNLALMRGRGWNCNDGTESTPEAPGVIPDPGDVDYKGGTYLRKYRPSRDAINHPCIDLWGDNRRTNPHLPDEGVYAPYIYANDISDAGNLMNPRAAWSTQNTKSIIYKDDKGIPCLHISESDKFQFSDEAPLKVDSFWDIGPSYDPQDSTLYTDGDTEHSASNLTWEWDNFNYSSYESNIRGISGNLSGKTICMNFCIEKRQLEAGRDYLPDAYYILDRPGEFSIQYLPATREIMFKYGSEKVSQIISEVEETLNMRVACSVDFTEKKLLLVVNNHEPVIKPVTDIDPLYPRKPIGIFHSVDKEGLEIGYGSGATFGNIYDLRLYTRACSPLDLWILSTGTKRELYSYAPSIYQLASAVYDKGAFKKVCYDAGIITPSNNILRKIRLFDRPVWNSILVDLSPVSSEESSIDSRSYNRYYYDSREDEDVFEKNDDGHGSLVYEYKDSVLEQTLLKDYESFSRQSPQEDIDLQWAGNKYSVKSGDPCNVVSTILYPHRYRNKTFRSGVKFSYIEGSSVDNKMAFSCYNKPIQIPVSVSHNSLVYKSELGINFTIPNTSWAYGYEDRGSNIHTVWDSSLNDFVVRHKDIGKEKTSSNNKVLIPLLLLSQPGADNLSPEMGGYALSGLKLKGIKLKDGISAMLRASSYYNEIKFPVAYYDVNDNFEAKYLDKWDGIRIFKEGEYYFTCKYPVRIMSFLQESTANNETPATLYAAVRFKIAVHGSPVEFDSSKYPVAEVGQSLYGSSTKSLFEIYKPDDNRSFPHREISINVYSMKIDFEDLLKGIPSKYCSWDLVASNDPLYKNDNDVVYLDKATISSEIPIKKEIVAYFSSNYTAPLLKMEDGKEAFDIVPVRIVKNRETESTREKLSVKNSSELKKLRLNSGRTYQLLIDYSGNLVEASYSAKSLGNMVSEYQGLTPISSAYSKKTEYMYTDTCAWLQSLLPSSIVDQTSGYDTSAGDWLPVDESTGILGDPYSLNSEKDALLGSLSDNLKSKYHNCSIIPYRVESSEKISALWLGITDEWNIIGNSGTLERVNTTEKSILTSEYERLKSQVVAALQSMMVSCCGAIQAISEIAPNMSSYGQEVSLKNKQLLDQDLYKIKMYSSNKKNTPISSNVLSETVSLYGENLISNNDYFGLEGSSAWYASCGNQKVGGYIVTDDKDVYAAQIGSVPLNLRYGSTSVLFDGLRSASGSDSKIEVPLKVKGDPVSVQISYLDSKSNVISTSPVLSVVASDLNKWATMSYEANVSSIRSISITISSSGQSEVLFGEVSLRKRTKDRSYNGLSDSILSGTSTPGTSPLEINPTFNIVWQSSEDPKEAYPLQFRPSSIRDGVRNLTTNENVISNLWSSYKLEDATLSGSIAPGFHNMLNPWRRCFVYRQKENERDLLNKESCRIYPYYIEKDQAGVFRRKISPMSSEDLFEIRELNTEYDDSASAIRINPLYIKNGGEATVLGSMDSSMFIDKENPENAIYVGEESFSCISNARNPQKYYSKKDSYVPITNIQVMGSTNNLGAENIVFYEYENLPLIYNETTQHIGVSFFVKETQ